MLEPLTRESVLDSAALRAVDRAIADLRRGDVLMLRDADGGLALIQAAEGASDSGLRELAQLSGRTPVLLLTEQRAKALDLLGDDQNLARQKVFSFDLTNVAAIDIAAFADPSITSRPVNGMSLPRSAVASGLDAAAIELAKLARLLPAILMAPLPHVADLEDWIAAQGLSVVDAEDISQYTAVAARNHKIVASARVPLSAAEDTQIVAFRPSDGGIEQLALIIGEPSPDEAVLTRLHSECLTGDILGSLRCDCGDQLRGAIKAIAEAGGGIVLYLAQEGRGIGLVNKLRAYELQDRGADTLEANQQLGFDADERIYLPAAEILRLLGYRRVRLLTNNPDKVTALTRCGIAVEERVPHSFPSNGHNDFYLRTKASRFGHLF